MPALRQNHWQHLQEFLLRLHATPTLAELPATILAGLREVIPYDSGSLQDDRGGLHEIPWLFQEQSWQPQMTGGGELGVRMMSHWDPEFTSMRDAFFAASADHHPHSAYYRRTGDGSARRLSDIVPLRALRKTTFFNEISRKNRLVRQLTIYFSAPPENTVVLALCRETPDFSERDRFVLDTLRPHIVVAWLQAWDRERTRFELHQLRDRQIPRLTGKAVTMAACQQFPLTPREAEVLAWVTEGKTNREIAVILGLSAGTVKCYVERILAKLGCETRTAAARSVLESVAFGH